MPQFAKPTGFFGKILARGMAWGHRDFYRNAAKALDLKHDDKYLEIGFGSGLFIKKYASHIARIAGLDCSEDMVKMANGINDELVESGKAEFKKGFASHLPWNDNEFSAISAIETFFFWPEPLKSLKEIFRVLVPGGRVVIEMAFNKDDGMDHSKHIKKMNLKLYGSKKMNNMLEKAGFSNITVTYYKGAWAPFVGYIAPRGMVVKAIKSV